MTRYRYTRYLPNPADEVDLEDLMSRLRDFFLQSGFFDSRSGGRQGQSGMEQLRRALAGILQDDPSLPEDLRQDLADYTHSPEHQLAPESEEFLNQLVRRLMEEGYLKMAVQPGAAPPQTWGEGEIEDPSAQVQFELTDKGVDFLGYRTLKDLMNALGHGSFGRHDTERLCTGVASDSPSRPYEFGDTLNLDINRTLLKSIQRNGLRFPLELDYRDLRVYQTEHQSSCATVLMLDCSHSMILYGEDRFTPAKQVALALAHLIRTHYPGDSLDLVLFHDSAEQVDLVRLPSVKVGPYHTNTCEGLKLSRQILRNQRKEMRQIIMITDGKPSAITLPNGQIYKNPFGLDPMILEETFREVANCRKGGIMINTFMVARDHHLVEFVKQVARICRGRAYFTNTLTLAGYLIMDFMSGKSKTVH